MNYYSFILKSKFVLENMKIDKGKFFLLNIPFKQLII